MSEASSFLQPLQFASRYRSAFVERIPGIPGSTEKATAVAKLAPHHTQAAHKLGFREVFYAEQIHGRDVAIIDENSPLESEGVDALITQSPLLLGIHVADCGALYLLDPITEAIGLIHSGKKGTERNITAHTIREMGSQFGTDPANLIAVLAPCIRPPHYEIDFASHIRQQALATGVLPENYHDCGLCTASDLDRFYSYRVEKGNTGRHLALFGKTSS